jgi:uncharacterized phage infection (PIP) family protein YhgE
MKKILDVVYYIMGLTGFLIILGSVDSTLLTLGEMVLLEFGGLSLMVLSLVAITYNNRK